ncbi:MAG: Na/Pi cotransporter family protein, partial [Erysipelotrichaceae bacterium]|nr:Na/Pi cotransporter family protein [Erysipelotrichaceae bacterium]
MKFSDILSVLSGLAIFLYGMEVMGNGFKHMAGGKLQDVLEKLTKKPLVAMLAGMLVTALVQSSGATTSMLVSFVNAGIMRVEQTVYVILGSNVGTTITGHLMALDVGLVSPFLAFIGVCLIMFVKNDKLNAIGEIMMGLGFVFIGMDTMSGGLAPLGSSPFFLKILTSMRNPVFGILVGFVLTTIVQSSSASLGIIQSLAKSGLVQIKDVMFFNLGQNIGSCTTAMLASLSFNRDAKRVSIINLTFNIVNAVLFTILYSLFPFDRLYQTLAPGSVVEQIAFMHTFTNIVTSLVCFPIAGVLAKVAYLFIPDQG